MVRAWIKSSRTPVENGGKADSEDFGSAKTLGELLPLSTAGTPNSVSQIGFDCGIHAVGLPSSVPFTRSKWGLDHQLLRSFGRYTQGLLAAPSVIGVRIWLVRSASLA